MNAHQPRRPFPISGRPPSHPVHPTAAVRRIWPESHAQSGHLRQMAAPHPRPPLLPTPPLAIVNAHQAQTLLSHLRPSPVTPRASNCGRSPQMAGIPRSKRPSPASGRPSSAPAPAAHTASGHCVRAPGPDAPFPSSAVPLHPPRASNCCRSPQMAGIPRSKRPPPANRRLASAPAPAAHTGHSSPTPCPRCG